MLFIRTLLLLCIIKSSAYAATKLRDNLTKLGKVHTYTSYYANKEVELNIMRLNERKEGLVLINFNIPGSQLHQKSFVYKEHCETTRCQKIFYKQAGGTSTHLISEDGYFGKSLYALLPDEKDKVYLVHNHKRSALMHSKSLYNNYLNTIYKDRSWPEIKTMIKNTQESFNTHCQASMRIDTNLDLFKQKRAVKLLGMGKPFLDTIAATCKDPLYQEIFSKISKVVFLPSDKPQKMELSKMRELIIYLWEDLHNPAIVAQSDMEKL